MNDSLNLVLKVLIASTLISIAIKYGGPFLPIPATSAVALGIVLLPTVIMAIALTYRSSQS